MIARLSFLLLLMLLLVPQGRAQSWTEVAAMPTPREYAAVAVLQGKIYVIGGRGANGLPVAVVERYDPVTNMWETVGSLRDARSNAAAALYNGQILLMGGREYDGEATDDVEAYNLAENRWESFDHLEVEREGLAAFSLGSVVYAFGGSDENQSLRNDAEAYDGDDWYSYSSWTLGVARAAFAAAPLQDGVLIFGGYSIFGPESDVEYYVPDQGGVLRAPLPEPRGGIAGVSAMGRAYAIGGGNAASQAVARVDVYDPSADAWTDGTPLPVGREGAVAAAVDDEIYIFGGRTTNGTLVTSSLSLVIGTAAEPDAPRTTFTLTLDGPNPFRDRTRFMLALDRPETVQVAVFDALGRRVALLQDGPLAAGRHPLDWDGHGEAGRLPSGTYLVRATTGSAQVVRRITTVR